MAPTWALYPLIVPGDLRHGDRLAGADHGGVLGHQAGDPARLPAAPAHRAHLRARDRADLRAVRQLGPVRLHRASRSSLFGSSSKLAAAYGIAVTIDMLITTIDDLLRRSATAGSTRGRCASRATGFFFVVDFAFFAANIVKVLRRRLVPARHRRRDVHADDDLEAGPQADVASACATRRSTCRASSSRCSSARRRACRARRSSSSATRA